ncbi:MAG: PE family protein [Mycobacterium sp.]|nr:MAG: PE family protein [Mycobacterium sp.]
MSNVSVVPEIMTAAAADLGKIASVLGEAHRSAASATLALSPAAADEVSVGIAQLFAQHAQDFQVVAREAAAFHEEFVSKLTASSSAYASAEHLSAAMLRDSGPRAADSTSAWQNLNYFVTFFPVLVLLMAAIPPLWILFPFLPFFFLWQVVSFLFEGITGLPLSLFVVGPP